MGSKLRAKNSSPSSASERPDIFQFLNPMAYLKEMIEYLKNQRSFSHRSFCQRAGFASPSYLKMILDEKRKPSEKSVPKLAKGLRLSKAESKFFELLCLFHFAEEGAKKEGFYRGLLKFKKFSQTQRLNIDHFHYYSNWRNVIIREALSTAWGTENLESLREKLKLSEVQMQEALHTLLSLGLIEKTGETYRSKEVVLQTPKAMQHMSIRSFHRQMIELGKDALEKIEVSKRDVSSVTLPLTEEQFLELKERISQFRAEINSVYSVEEDARQVYQINFQVFPILEKELFS